MNAQRQTTFEDTDGGHSAGRHCHSFGWTAATWSLIGTAFSAATTIASADQQRHAANQANDQAVAAAKANAQQADEAFNRANAKSPDTAAMLSANLAAGKQGASGTMLTGPGGVDPSTLLLGRSSLLGG